MHWKTTLSYIQYTFFCSASMALSTTASKQPLNVFLVSLSDLSGFTKAEVNSSTEFDSVPISSVSGFTALFTKSLSRLFTCEKEYQKLKKEKMGTKGLSSELEEPASVKERSSMRVNCGM